MELVRAAPVSGLPSLLIAFVAQLSWAIAEPIPNSETRIAVAMIRAISSPSCVTRVVRAGRRDALHTPAPHALVHKPVALDKMNAEVLFPSLRLAICFYGRCFALVML